MQLSTTTNRACVICGYQADIFEGSRRINLCSLHHDDLAQGRPWTLDIEGEENEKD